MTIMISNAPIQMLPIASKTGYRTIERTIKIIAKDKPSNAAVSSPKLGLVHFAGCFNPCPKTSLCLSYLFE